MIRAFEEIRTCSPANPNETAPEGAMPKAVWAALFWDAVQGFRPPWTSDTLCWWSQTTHPRAWAIGAPQASPPTHHHCTGKGKGKEKAPGKGARSGPR